MLQRLNYRQNEKPENARKRFDRQLAVQLWGSPTHAMDAADTVDPATPWWWDGAEDASQSFLTSMGVNLT